MKAKHVKWDSMWEEYFENYQGWIRKPARHNAECAEESEPEEKNPFEGHTAYYFVSDGDSPLSCNEDPILIQWGKIGDDTEIWHSEEGCSNSYGDNPEEADACPNNSQTDCQAGIRAENQVESQICNQFDSQVDSQIDSQIGCHIRNQADSQIDSQIGCHICNQADSQNDSPSCGQTDSQDCHNNQNACRFLGGFPEEQPALTGKESSQVKEEQPASLEKKTVPVKAKTDSMAEPPVETFNMRKEFPAAFANRPEGIIFECGPGMGIAFSSFDEGTIPGNAQNHFIPKTLGTVAIDTSCLRKPKTRILFNCSITFTPVSEKGSALLEFVLSRSCRNGDESPIGNWIYDIKQKSGSLSQNFRLSYCSCNTFPGCFYYFIRVYPMHLEKCCVCITNCTIDAVAQSLLKS